MSETLVYLKMFSGPLECVEGGYTRCFWSCGIHRKRGNISSHGLADVEGVKVIGYRIYRTRLCMSIGSTVSHFDSLSLDRDINPETGLLSKLGKFLWEVICKSQLINGDRKHSIIHIKHNLKAKSKLTSRLRAE